MNRRDMDIARVFSGIFENGGVYIMNVKFHQLTRLNLLLLKALADMNRKKGIIITIERPHHYLTYLLGIHGVRQRNLTYVDLAASRDKKITFPLKFGLAKDVFIGGFLQRDIIILDDYDFILIDNIASMRIHLSEESIRRFTGYIVQEVKKRNMIAVFPIDRERAKSIYESLKSAGTEEMDAEGVMLVAN